MLKRVCTSTISLKVQWFEEEVKISRKSSKSRELKALEIRKFESLNFPNSENSEFQGFEKLKNWNIENSKFWENFGSFENSKKFKNSKNSKSTRWYFDWQFDGIDCCEEFFQEEISEKDIKDTSKISTL